MNHEARPYFRAGFLNFTMKHLDEIKAALPADLKQIERVHGREYAAQIAAPHVLEFLNSKGYDTPDIDDHEKQYQLLKHYALKDKNPKKDSFIAEAMAAIEILNGFFPTQPNPTPPPPPPPPAPNYTPWIIGGATAIALILIFRK